MAYMPPPQRGYYQQQPYAQPPQPRRPRDLSAVIRAVFFVLFGLLALVIILIIVSAVVPGVNGPQPAYKARVQDFVVINPADLAVTVRVTNTGKAAGTPQCTVQANDPAYAYTGTDVATLSGQIKPGAFAVYVDNVTITGQGAQYVTSVTASCS